MSSDICNDTSNIPGSGGEEDILTLVMDDDTELHCYIIAIFDVNDREYIALDPIDSDEYDKALVYRYSESEDGEMILDNIEDDDEYEAVADVFDEFMDAIDLDAE